MLIGIFALLLSIVFLIQKKKLGEVKIRDYIKREIYYIRSWRPDIVRGDDKWRALAIISHFASIITVSIFIILTASWVSNSNMVIGWLWVILMVWLPLNIGLFFAYNQKYISTKIYVFTSIIFVNFAALFATKASFEKARPKKYKIGIIFNLTISAYPLSLIPMLVSMYFYGVDFMVWVLILGIILFSGSLLLSTLAMDWGLIRVSDYKWLSLLLGGLGSLLVKSNDEGFQTHKYENAKFVREETREHEYTKEIKRK